MSELTQPHFESELEPPNGEPLTVETALANLTHEDVSLRYYAAWWLGKFGAGSPGVVEALITALHDEDDRTELGGYPLRRNAARALGKLGDRRAVPELLQALECPDYYVQAAAAQSLGMLGRSVLHSRDDASAVWGSGVGSIDAWATSSAKPVEAAMEALEALRATEAAALMEPFLHHPIPRVQYAAARALYVLTQNSVYGERLVRSLSEADLKLRRKLLLDLGASGYLPGAAAIAHASVENSFKMIALKSLLESNLKQTNPVALSPAATQVMTLMDALL